MVAASINRNEIDREDWIEGYLSLSYDDTPTDKDSGYNVVRRGSDAIHINYNATLYPESLRMSVTATVPHVVPGKIEKGCQVRIHNEDNPRLHGTLGIVIKVDEWGCHLSSLAAATGRYRASWEEMTLVSPNPIPEYPEAYGNEWQPQTVEAYLSKPQAKTKEELTREAKDKGCTATGDFCTVCGSADMVRTGACLSCLNCGQGGSCG